MSNREAWASRIGLVLAMAGNAVGLGNFLRFPRQAALNGGGAFLIPYFVAFLALGIPLMWVEWSMGRYGGQFNQSTTAGQFDRMWRNRWAKILGSLGISIPLLITIYYCYIESWTLAYTFFSVGKTYFGSTEQSSMNLFLRSYQGIAEGGPFSSMVPAVGFWLVTLGLNLWVVYRGISGGIEKLAKIAMPLLVVFAIILVVRVITLGTPDPAYPDRNVGNGFGFVWNPDLSLLGSFPVWLAAAGQIFFTLSIGSGSIQTYASYLKKDDDCAVTGLATCATNEFVEVVLGGSIAIPIAVAFFGLEATRAIAAQGSFDLGFVAMPVIFQKLPLGAIFGALWFSLLFFAGITSSVALLSPFVALLKENMGLSRKAAVAVTGGVLFVFGLPILLLLQHGYMDQYDFWIGTVLLVVFSLIETLIFVFAFGRASGGGGGGILSWLRNAGVAGWEEMNRGADMRIPRIFFYIIKLVLPLLLIFLLVGWLWEDLTSKSSVILMRGVEGEAALYQWISRGSIILLMVGVAVLVAVAWKRREQ
jgi:SNF family Na+-dependent transporter